MRDSPIGMIKGGARLKFHKEVGPEEKIDRLPGQLQIGSDTKVPILLFRCKFFSFHSYFRAFITFGEKELKIFQLEDVVEESEEGSQVQKTLQYKLSYSAISLIYVQNFEGHIGVSGANTDVEFFSSYSQMIVNEIVLRSARDISVQFGEFTRKFEYGDPILRTLNPQHDDAEGSFSRPTFKLSETIMSNVPKQVRDDLKKQEKAVEKVQDAVEKISAINKETKEELERQNKQLNEIHSNVDAAHQRGDKAQFKVKKYHS